MKEEKVEIHIEGMSCVSCARGIETALHEIKGVNQVVVNFVSEKAIILFDPTLTTLSQLLHKVRDAGYRPSLEDKSKDSVVDIKLDENKSTIMPLIISGLLTLPLVLQMVGGAFGHLEHIPIWIQAILATIVQFYGGANFFRGSYYALRAKSPNMDLLICLGTSAAYFFSMSVFLFRLSAPLYFESSMVIITLVLLGRWIENRSKLKASAAIEKLMKLQPKIAKVERQGQFIDLPVEEILIDDIFLVRPGENIPVDGLVFEGDSAINESMLTGESMPVHKHFGSKVFAGTTNVNGVLKVHATQVGSSTFLASIIQLVENAQNSKAPIQRLADKVSGIFVPIILLLSILTFVGWLLVGAPLNQALINMVAVLVIACPCALGLATPTVIMVASGVGASHGILFREAAALEEAGKIQTLILDKTGTLTEGKATVHRIVPEKHIQENELLKIAAAIEKNSQHPLAEAIVNYALAKKISIEPVDHLENFPGRGLKASKRDKTYYLGSTAFAREKNINIDLQDVEFLEKDGSALVVIWEEQRLLGYISISDPVRPLAAKAVRHLHKMGIHIIMMTGDHAKAASTIAKLVGVEEYFPRVLPGQKAEQILELRERKKIVGMVGDGINDAPALAAANVGFSLGAGSDIALEASDVTLVRNDIMAVPQAIALSRAAMIKIKQNLFFAFVYNIIGIPLAAFGALDPVIAAAAMAMSSLSVVGNALLMRYWHYDDF